MTGIKVLLFAVLFYILSGFALYLTDPSIPSKSGVDFIKALFSTKTFSYAMLPYPFNRLMMFINTFVLMLGVGLSILELWDKIKP